MEINISEEVEMKKIQQAILQISGSASRLGVDVNKIKIYIPKVDHEYFSRMISNNPNWSCSKYCKIVSNDLILINNIKVISRGVGDV